MDFISYFLVFLTGCGVGAAFVQSRLQAAKKANARNIEIISQLNHALRTPLTTLTGSVEILETSQDSLDPNQRRILQTLKSSTQSLTTIVNDIPDLSDAKSDSMR